jgi:hypothetical protein
MKIMPYAAACTLVASAFAAPPKQIEIHAVSCYDRSTARSLTEEETPRFGPQSARFRYDTRMIRAAEIASARANKHSAKKCWRSVKDALVAAKALPTRPDTVYAKQAAAELSGEYGYKRLSVRDPYRAPVGSVLVYGGRGAGHVELRTRTGFVSDFYSLKPSSRPFIGAFVKPDA